MRQVALIIGVSHSTISRYKNNIYKKRKIDIKLMVQMFILNLKEEKNKIP